MKLIYENLNLYGIMELICEIIGLILQSIKLIYQSTSLFLDNNKSYSFLHFDNK